MLDVHDRICGTGHLTVRPASGLLALLLQVRRSQARSASVCLPDAVIPSALAKRPPAALRLHPVLVSHGCFRLHILKEPSARSPAHRPSLPVPAHGSALAKHSQRRCGAPSAAC